MGLFRGDVMDGVALTQEIPWFLQQTRKFADDGIGWIKQSPQWQVLAVTTIVCVGILAKLGDPKKKQKDSERRLSALAFALLGCGMGSMGAYLTYQGIHDASRVAQLPLDRWQKISPMASVLQRSVVGMGVYGLIGKGALWSAWQTWQGSSTPIVRQSILRQLIYRPEITLNNLFESPLFQRAGQLEKDGGAPTYSWRKNMDDGYGIALQLLVACRQGLNLIAFPPAIFLHAAIKWRVHPQFSMVDICLDYMGMGGNRIPTIERAYFLGREFFFGQVAARYGTMAYWTLSAVCLFAKV